MASVNLRGMPEELVRRAKARAALGGRSLKAYVIDVLEAAVSVDSDGLGAALGADEKRKKKEKKKNKKHRKKERKSAG